MIRDIDKIEEKLIKEMIKQAKEFINELKQLSTTKNFTIDNIEQLMKEFNSNSKKQLLHNINDVISSYDETKLIEEKKEE